MDWFTLFGIVFYALAIQFGVKYEVSLYFEAKPNPLWKILAWMGTIVGAAAFYRELSSSGAPTWACWLSVPIIFFVRHLICFKRSYKFVASALSPAEQMLAIRPLEAKRHE